MKGWWFLIFQTESSVFASSWLISEFKRARKAMHCTAMPASGCSPLVPQPGLWSCVMSMELESHTGLILTGLPFLASDPNKDAELWMVKLQRITWGSAVSMWAPEKQTNTSIYEAITRHTECWNYQSGPEDAAHYPPTVKMQLQSCTNLSRSKTSW